MTLIFDSVEVREAVRRQREVMFVYGYRNKEDDVKVISEHLYFLRKSESKRTPWAKTSPDNHSRKSLVNFMMKMGADEDMTNETVYLAIYLLDRFMDGHKINANMLPYVGTSCMVLVAKLLGIEDVPKYKHFKKYVSREYQNVDTRVKTLINVESCILNYFKFDIMIPTEVEFLEIYLLYSLDGLVANKEMNNNNNSTDLNANYSTRGRSHQSPPVPKRRIHDRDLYDAIWQRAFYVLEEINKAGNPCKHPASLVAAAILMIARREYELNFWTPTLEKITSYSMQTVYHSCVDYVEPYVRCTMYWKKHFIAPTFLNAVCEADFFEVLAPLM